MHSEGVEKGTHDGLEEEDEVTMEDEATGEGGEAAADAHLLTHTPVLETSAPPQGGRDEDAGAQEGEKKPRTP